jgi:aryl-alcohol dehydrogenase-like predicted oxidoreductase
MYSQGESEALLGRAFRGVRSQVVIASKAGYCLPGRRKLAARLKPILRPVLRLLKIRRDRLPAGARGSLAQDFSPSYLQRAVEGSLRRLRTDYLDLLQLHSPPADVVERGEWEPALRSLQQAGKIRYYGVSCDTVEAGLAALRFPNVSSLQFVLSLLEPRAGDVLLPEVRAKGVAAIARECLANGLLAKSSANIDLAAYCSSPEQVTMRAEQLQKFGRLAADQRQSVTRLALDYVADTGGVSVTLLGARSVDQLKGLVDQVQHRRS